MDSLEKLHYGLEKFGDEFLVNGSEVRKQDK